MKRFRTIAIFLAFVAVMLVGSINFSRITVLQDQVVGPTPASGFRGVRF